MKKIISAILVIIMLCSMVVFPISGTSTDRAVLTVRTINGETTSVYVNGEYVGDAPYYAEAKKDSTVKLVCSDESFLGYMDTTFNTLSEDGEYTFTLSGSTTVYSFSENTNPSKVMVIYRNTNTTKQILSYSTYSDITRMKGHLSDSASLFGYEFVAWDKTVEEIKGLANSGESTIVVNPVYSTTTEKCVISVTNGKVNGETSASVIIGSQVTLTADVPELDQKFAYWINSNGDVISDSATFTMFAPYDETYRAVYVASDEEVKLSPSSSLKYSYLEDIDKIEIFTQRFIPSGVKVKENGLLYVKDGEIEESAMTLENVDGTTLCKVLHTVTNTSGVVRNTASCEEYISLRPFITYEADGETLTVYGSMAVARKNPNETVWVDEDFETLASITASTLTNNNKMPASAASGFSIATSGDNKLASSASTGGYLFFNDSGLDLAKAEVVTISSDVMLTAYPSDTISLITFITSGSGYNFFLKINSSGQLVGSDYGIIKDASYTPYVMELNRSYKIKIVYDIATQIYDLYLDGTFISSESFSTDIRNATSLVVRFFESGKGAVGTLDNIKITTSTADAARVALNTLSSWSSVHFDVSTDKNPVLYSADEEMTFTFDLRNGTGGAACEQFKLQVKTDDDPTAKTVMLDGSAGVATYTTSLEEAGFVYITATACDASGNAYSGSETATVGAGADIFDITASETRPSDFDSFWASNVEGLMAIDPEIVEMTLISQTSTYKAYNVKIKAVDDSSVYSDGADHDYVAGILTVPAGADAGSCGIKITLDGYAVKSASIKYEADTIVFNPIAHSIDANSDSAYYTAYNNGDLNCYGGLYTSGANTDRDEVYFKNMVLRDIQALRFVTEYFGSDGEKLWDGTTVRVEGASQGGFRTSALCALAKDAGIEISSAYIDMAWLCDINAEANGRIFSRFWPEFTYSAMQYYDTVFFGDKIECEVEMRTGLGDDIAPPTGVTALYNAIASSDKSITYVQNRVHGSSGTSNESFTVYSGETVYNYVSDGKAVGEAPEGDHVVYVRSSDDTEWSAWDYENDSVKNIDASLDYSVYFFEVDTLFESASALTAANNLTTGMRVGTESYYKGVGRGAAIYEISSTAGSSDIAIKLDNGLYAKVVPFEVGKERVVTVDMAGAYGDGEQADQDSINAAFKFADANVIEFESSVYMQENSISLNRGGVRVNGKSAEIHNRYDETYVLKDFTVSGTSTNTIKNIIIENLTLVCTEKRGVGHLYSERSHGQFFAAYADGITVRGCTFRVPPTDEGEEYRNSSCVGFGTCTTNITFENNKIFNFARSEGYSGGLHFAPGLGNLSENIKVVNNYIEKSGHDEILAFYMGEFDNIVVENNTFYTHDELVGYTSQQVIGFGVWDCPTTVKNAVFSNNKLDVVTLNNAIMFSDVENIKIFDKEITVRNNSESEPITYGVFRVTYLLENYVAAGIEPTQKNVEVYNNTVKVYNPTEVPMNYNCNEGFDFHDNEYTFNIVE